MVGMRCSFCGRHDSQVEKLVAGPRRLFARVYICDRCIELSQEVLDLVRRTASRTRVVPVNAVTLFGVLAVSFMMGHVRAGAAPPGLRSAAGFRARLPAT